MAWALRLAHAGTFVHALLMSLLLHRYHRDAPTVRARAHELIRYAEEQGFAVHAAMGRVFLGCALAELGQPEQGIESMRRGFEEQQAIGTREDLPALLDVLATAYAATGRAQLGLDVLDQALAETARSGLSYWTAELHRCRGEVLMALSDEHQGEAVACFRRALDLSRAQGARSLELRAAMSRARLEQSRGESGGAYDLLAPVYAWFREGFETRDLQEAKALLDDLAARDAGRPSHSESRRPLQP
jgi:predicted ATPase